MYFVIIFSVLPLVITSFPSIPVFQFDLEIWNGASR